MLGTIRDSDERSLWCRKGIKKQVHKSTKEKEVDMEVWEKEDERVGIGKFSLGRTPMVLNGGSVLLLSPSLNNSIISHFISRQQTLQIPE